MKIPVLPNIRILDIPVGWNVSIEPIHAEDTLIYRFSMSHAGPAVPSQCMLTWDMPCTDICGRWTSGACHAKNIPPDWRGASYVSSLASNSPVVCLYSAAGTNRLTFAFSDALRTVKIQTGVREEDCHVLISLVLFSQPEAPLDSYEAYLRLDMRPVLYSDAISEAAKWFETFPEYTPAPVPEAAFAPIYSSWYTFHQNLFDSEVEKECRIASGLSMKGVIIDDGWQTEDTNRGYAFCGDWNISRRRFSDMASHVRRIHGMGMKYLVWYAVPYVGFKSSVYPRFKGKFLREYSRISAAVLDPRFPDVREYLIGIYETALREWDIDGFKLDFIDSFTFPDNHDPAADEAYAGRDIQSLPVAIDTLLADIMRRLRAIKPDILIEFRQTYIGPAIRKYGNMFRSSDCPCDYLTNRVHTIDLRLTSGNTAVHADMLEWHPSETPEHAALAVLNILFAVPQISVRLESLPEAHRRMLEFWLGFYTEHCTTLMKGRLIPRSPECLYPLVTAEGEDEDIHALYNSYTVVPVRPRKTFIANATIIPSVVIDLPQVPARITAFTCTGEQIQAGTLPEAGLARIAIPAGGLAIVEF